MFSRSQIAASVCLVGAVALLSQEIFQLGGVTRWVTAGSVTNCASSASPAVCVVAPAGSAVIAAAATTIVVNTTVVTANSQIFIMPDSSLGTRLSVTCNTTIPTLSISARTVGTSFTVTANVAPVTNPLCLSYQIIN